MVMAKLFWEQIDEEQSQLTKGDTYNGEEGTTDCEKDLAVRILRVQHDVGRREYGKV
jgi:hypothetical protein